MTTSDWLKRRPEPAGTGWSGADVACAQAMVDALTAHGRISPSVYETGRVVSLLPELTGHAERIDFLLTSQQPQGHWGPAHAGYAIIPTLSATEALLTVQQRGPHDSRIAAAVRHSVRGLTDLTDIDLPDLPAADLIVAMLVPRIEQQLSVAGTVRDSPQHLPGPLRELAHRSGSRLAALRSLASSTAQPEPKLLHAAENLTETPWLDRVRPSAAGSIGASPAATAAWLAHANAARRRPGTGVAHQYLRRVVQQHRGPVPCVWPAPVFERAWVLNWLLHAGMTPKIPHHLRRSLRASLGPEGVVSAPGLLPDADTTSMVLATLTLLGEPVDPAPLFRYELDSHFCTWPGEQGQSVTTNAHVLEALSHYVRARPAEMHRYASTIRKVFAWLTDQQFTDAPKTSGHWKDRWHASPYYATFCAALALQRAAVALPRSDSTRSQSALTATMRWLLGTQHSDGSWGCWGGTAEETAYAIHLLVSLPGSDDPGPKEAVNRARAHLERKSPHDGHPPLWHDKDLYAPDAIINAAVLTALLENP